MRAKANLDAAEDRNQLRAVHMAVQNNHLAVLEVLLAAGAELVDDVWTHIRHGYPPAII